MASGTRLWVILLAGLITACSPSAQVTPAQRANPASVHCTEAGGRLTIEKNGAGGEFGVCLFEDNRQCEEWALLRGQCPMGGVRVTGYATPAGRFCAITGGRYTVTPGSESAERGTCTLQDGRRCEAQALFNGMCESP